MERLNIKPFRHILNSAGILQFADYQFDMVRLGIGLYGANPTSSKFNIQPVSSLKTVISQIKIIKKGETIGYGRQGKAQEDMRLATLPIGYADGYARGLSNGKGSVYLHGKLASVIGMVCMDMMMVDITNIDAAEEGDEVEIFGVHISLKQLADQMDTIPYELLVRMGERIKRVFYQG